MLSMGGYVVLLKGGSPGSILRVEKILCQYAFSKWKLLFFELSILKHQNIYVFILQYMIKIPTEVFI